jgi:hypothetical protein
MDAAYIMAGFSAMAAIKTKYHSVINLKNDLGVANLNSYISMINYVQRGNCEASVLFQSIKLNAVNNNIANYKKDMLIAKFYVKYVCTCYGW